MKKVVVFGGAGFLGSHVADSLTEHGYKVTIFDHAPSKYAKPAQKMVVGSILDEKLVDNAVAGCDIVYNFAGIADIDEASQKPLESVKSNILGNTIILEACRKANVKRFMFASSLYVYSKAGSFYRSTKQSCELLIENYHEIYHLPYTILRYGSLYGPRASDTNFIRQIIKQAFQDKRIVREGDGEEIREYINVLDSAKTSVDVLSDEFVNQYVMITGAQPMKIKDMLLMIKEILDGKLEIKYVKPNFNYHYEITPYTFVPKVAKRVVAKAYMDLGQGLLAYIEEIYKELNPRLTADGFIITDKKAAHRK